MKNLTKNAPKMVLVFLMALLLFNFPMLAAFNKLVLWWGIPQILIYIFSVWLLVIMALFFIFRKKEY
jgi:hypothetical protein